MTSRFVACLLFALVGLAGWTCLSAADAAAGPRVLKLRAGIDNAMKFDVTRLSAAPGETVTVSLTNASSLPKNVMGHNWILLVAGTDPTAFAAAAAAEAQSGYIPAKLKEKMLAHIDLLGPGETGEVTFKAPGTAGEYPFLCSFPGHCVVGMKGTLVVK
jgi:azurin